MQVVSKETVVLSVVIINRVLFLTKLHTLNIFWVEWFKVSIHGDNGYSVSI